MMYNIGMMEQYGIQDWIDEKYWNEQLSINQIAVLYPCSYTSMHRWMEKYCIGRRDMNDARRLRGGGNSIKYEINETIFEKCDSPEKAYWIGFIMADGCVSISHRGEYLLVIRLKNGDKNHLEKFRQFLSVNIPIKERWITGGNAKPRKDASISISRKKIVDSLKQYGIVPRKTGKEQIKNIPQEYHSDFIRGYFDGDGCLLRAKKTGQLSLQIACASKLFIQSIQEILIKHCNLLKTKLPHRSNCYKLTYGGNLQVPRIFNYLLQNSDVKLERKYKLLEN